MKKCYVVVIAMCIFCTSCATKWVERSALNHAVMLGYRTDGALPGTVRAPENTTLAGLDGADAAWQFMPIKYFLANLFDYGVLPAAGIAGGTVLAREIDGDDNRSDDHREVQGDSVQVNGDNNTVTLDRSSITDN